MKEKYTKEMFKPEIISLIAKNGYDPIAIAKTTSKIFFRHQADIDLYLRDKMLDIMTMEDGPEFELTEEEFNDFLKKI